MFTYGFSRLKKALAENKPHPILAQVHVFPGWNNLGYFVDTFAKPKGYVFCSEKERVPYKLAGLTVGYKITLLFEHQDPLPFVYHLIPIK